jgi:hypothetical protein
MDNKIKLMSSRAQPRDLIFSVFISAVLTILVLNAGTTGKTSTSTRPSPMDSLRRTGATKRVFILPDGFVLNSVDGNLTQQDDNDIWFFTFESLIIDGNNPAGVGEKLELLPSSVLEKMIVDANAGNATSYRLWAEVTKYKGKNYIFPTKFLPLSEVKELPTVATSQQSQLQPLQQEIEEPNDELGIPKEILEKIRIGSSSPSTGRGRSGRTVRAIIGRQTHIKRNYVLVNRTGFLVKQSDGNMVFSLDALGLSAGSTGETFLLLPCQALELAEQLQSAVPNQVRFKIAGIVTEYRGKQFLLLHRALRVYSHGNFGL